MASGITADEAVALARTLRTVDEAAWRASTGAQVAEVAGVATTAAVPAASPDTIVTTGPGDPVVTETPVAAVGFPDLEALPRADVLAQGALEGRQWQVRAAVLPLLSGDGSGARQDPAADRLCASLDYAARSMVTLVCDESPTGSGVPGVVALVATSQPRTFLLALVEADVDDLTVGWADGTTTVAAATDIPGADGRGVVVVPVARGARVTSIATASGRVGVDVPGDRDAEIRLPDGVGGQTSIVSGP